MFPLLLNRCHFQYFPNFQVSFFSLVSFLVIFLAAYFLKRCSRSDPNVNTCLQDSANYLIANMRRGIPELGLFEPEPIVIDEIGIALGGGPDGYRATFKNIEAYGVSNTTVTAVRYVTYFYVLSKRKRVSRNHYSIFVSWSLINFEILFCLVLLGSLERRGPNFCLYFLFGINYKTWIFDWNHSLWQTKLIYL